MKHVKFGWPSKVESIVVALLLVTVFFLDINENKVLDRGIEHVTTWFGDITTKAINNFYAGILIYFLLFVILAIMALQSRKTHYVFDTIVSMVAIFGLVFIVGGFIADFHDVVVPFFNLHLAAIDFYHIGIGICVSMPVLLAVTD